MSSVLCVIALCVSVLCVSLYVYFIAFIATCVSVCYAVAYRVSAHYGFVCYISVTHKCVTRLSTVCVSIHAFEYITASPPCVRSHANHLLMFPSYSVCVCVCSQVCVQLSHNVNFHLCVIGTSVLSGIKEERTVPYRDTTLSVSNMKTVSCHKTDTLISHWAHHALIVKNPQTQT